MLVLAIETSSRRGSVALVESGNPLATSWHDEANAHGERLLGLIDQTFQTANRTPAQVTKVAVGRGPGAFTGLRVGLALAQGIASGLKVRAVGISSLRAMAAEAPAIGAGRRWPLLDARRGEVFLACYAVDGTELLAPRAVPRQGLLAQLQMLRANLATTPGGDWLLGHAIAELPEFSTPEFSANELVTHGFGLHRSDATDWPGAVAVGRLASHVQEQASPSPEYLRDADAVLPNLPPSPLARPREFDPLVPSGADPGDH